MAAAKLSTPLIRSIRAIAFSGKHSFRFLSSSSSSSSFNKYRHLSSSMNNNTLSSTATVTAAAASSNPPSSAPTKTVRVMIKGRVQGVFYRNWTVENARELGLNGWVRNRRDGSVEALFSGDPDSVHQMEQRCRRGPPDAMVTGFQVFPSDEDPGLGFDLKPTA